MAGTLSTAWRFVRADSASRQVGIIAGNAVGTFLIAAVAALPAALTSDDAPELGVRLTIGVALIFVAIPVFMLLATVGRLSAATRDARLMALRLLGLRPSRTLAVAAVENGLLSLAGALAGVAIFALAAPAASAAVRNGPGWFSGTLALSPLWLAAIALAAGLFSAVLAAAPARRLLEEPKAGRPRRRGTGGWWRLGLFGFGAAELVWLGFEPGLSYSQRTWAVACGVVAVLVGLVLSVPLFSVRVAAALAKSRRTVVQLAGRGIQAEPTSGARLVLGLGAVVFLAVALTGQLWRMENSSAIKMGQRLLGDGPQLLVMYQSSDDWWPQEDWDELGYPPKAFVPGPDSEEIPAAIPDDVIAAVKELPGVAAVVGHWTFDADLPLADRHTCDPASRYCGAPVFVGTCAELALFSPSTTGCSDQEVRWLETEPDSNSSSADASHPRPSSDTLSLSVEDWPADKPVQFDLSRQVIRLPPAPIRYDGAFWRFDYGGLFIPRQLAGPVLGSPAELWVLVDQGGLAIQEKLNAAVRPHGLVAVPEEMVYYNDEVMLLTGFWALITLAMAVASLNLAITAVDGAKERRPVVARQIALGVPGQVLRRAQTLQVAVPLTGAVGLGVIGGAAALVSYSLPDLRSGYIDFPWPQLGFALGTVVIGSALVLGLAAASTRLRLTPEDLRRE